MLLFDFNIVLFQKIIKKRFSLVIILYLIFPSTLHYASYISPNFLSILFNIIFFYFVIIRRFYIYFFLSLVITFIDYQNISHIFISLSFFDLSFNFQVFSNKYHSSFNYIVRYCASRSFT